MKDESIAQKIETVEQADSAIDCLIENQDFEEALSLACRFGLEDRFLEVYGEGDFGGQINNYRIMLGIGDLADVDVGLQHIEEQLSRKLSLLKNVYDMYVGTTQGNMNVDSIEMNIKDGHIPEVVHMVQLRLQIYDNHFDPIGEISDDTIHGKAVHIRLQHLPEGNTLYHIALLGDYWQLCNKKTVRPKMVRKIFSHPRFEDRVVVSSPYFQIGFLGLLDFSKAALENEKILRKWGRGHDEILCALTSAHLYTLDFVLDAFFHGVDHHDI